MAHGIVVLAGSLTVERVPFDSLVAEFGWSVKAADGLECLAALNHDHNVVTVFFSPQHLDLAWDEALSSVLCAAPKARPILCHGFSETVDWPRLAEAGAFHSIPLPLDVREVRQSLGFVWGAGNRSAAIPIQSGRGRVKAEGEPRRRGRAAAFVA